VQQRQADADASEATSNASACWRALSRGANRRATTIHAAALMPACIQLI
jgi:hypothetical protein